MKRTELLEKYAKLSDQQKEDLAGAGYFNSNGNHYGKLASFSLMIQDARGGIYIPLSRLFKNKQYSFRGAKVYGIHFTVMKQSKDVLSNAEFAGFGFGKVVNAEDITLADGEKVTVEEIKKEVAKKV